MIDIPVHTIEKPITIVDYIAHLQKCENVIEVGMFGQLCPMEIRQDDRFAKAVAGKLAEIHGRKAAA